MKHILSPYNDELFNEYLLQYVKKRLTKRCNIFLKDDTERRYFLTENSRDFYTYKDIIKSVDLINNRLICFTNQKLINHAVYDLGQRFWYDEFKYIANIIRKLYLEFKGSSSDRTITKRKLSHEKKAHRRIQGNKI